MDKFIIIKKIGQGGFGNVYYVKKIENTMYYALKTSRKSKFNLKYEFNILKGLSTTECVPKTYDCGYDFEGDFFYTMELLQINVIDYIDNMRDKNCFFSGSITSIFTGMIDCIKNVHDMGMLHGDIKPENFMVNKDKVYIIDFGCSKPYMHNKKHIMCKYTNNSTGSLEYMSLHNHSLLEISRRDDLISFGYTMVKILHMRLPWSTSIVSSRNIINKKKNTTTELLFCGLNNKLIELFEYILALGFSETPDYFYLKSLLINVDRYYVN